MVQNKYLDLDYSITHDTAVGYGEFQTSGPNRLLFDNAATDSIETNALRDGGIIVFSDGPTGRARLDPDTYTGRGGAATAHPPRRFPVLPEHPSLRSALVIRVAEKSLRVKEVWRRSLERRRGALRRRKKIGAAP